MPRGFDSRKKIFDFFSNHLNFLKANGFLKGTVLKYDRTYICPICLRQFSEKDIEDDAPNMLTIEHAPPHASGGKGVVLTCKQCNNVAGAEIDFHLTERIQEMERRNLLPNTSARVRVTSGDLTVQGDISVNADGVTTMRHSGNRNHPQRLLDFVDRVGPTTNPLIHIDFGKIQTDAHRMQVGLLKTAYIIAFAKLGYSFLLDGVYNPVRNQLLNPNDIIYPEGFWHKDHKIFTKHEGVHFCETWLVEGIHCIFPIKTLANIHYFGVHLPIPLVSIEKMVNSLHKLGPGGKLGDSMNLSPVEPKDNYFSDINKINKIYDWFFRVRLTKIGLNNYENIPMALSRLRYPLPKWYPLKPIYSANAGNFRAFAHPKT